MLTDNLSRNGEFNQGMTAPQATPSLLERSSKINSTIPRGFRANGLNQPFMMSPGNGNSSRDALRQTPSGQLPSMNGMSESTYNQQNPSSYGTDLGI